MNRILSYSTLRSFWIKHPDAEKALKTWHKSIRVADWQSPADIKRIFNSVSILKKGRIVFNIKGNRYRLVASINYQKKWVQIRFIGTHKEYDAVNANEI